MFQQLPGNRLILSGVPVDAVREIHAYVVNYQDAPTELSVEALFSRDIRGGPVRSGFWTQGANYHRDPAAWYAKIKQHDTPLD